MLSLATAFIIGALLGHFLPTYLSKKGENLATKEDIAEITDEIESVKSEYASGLESMKAELSAKLNAHGFRYENEYNILSELTALLVEVRDASMSLRPMLEFRDPEKSEEKIREEKLRRLYEARRNLYLCRERKRPFFPEDIYSALVAIEKTVHTEAIKYQHQNPFEKGNFLSYWEEAEKNQAEISSSAEQAMEKIRARVTEWESLVEAGGPK